MTARLSPKYDKTSYVWWINLGRAYSQNIPKSTFNLFRRFQWNIQRYNGIFCQIPGSICWAIFGSVCIELSGSAIFRVRMRPVQLVLISFRFRDICCLRWNILRVCNFFVNHLKRAFAHLMKVFNFQIKRDNAHYARIGSLAVMFKWQTKRDQSKTTLTGAARLALSNFRSTKNRRSSTRLG